MCFLGFFNGADIDEVLESGISDIRKVNHATKSESYQFRGSSLAHCAFVLCLFFHQPQE